MILKEIPEKLEINKTHHIQIRAQLITMMLRNQDFSLFSTLNTTGFQIIRWRILRFKAFLTKHQPISITRPGSQRI